MRRFTTTLIFALLICFLAACQSGSGRSGPIQTVAVTIVPTSTVEEVTSTPVQDITSTSVEEAETAPVEEIEATPVEETVSTSSVEESNVTSETEGETEEIYPEAYPAPYPEPESSSNENNNEEAYPGSETDEVVTSSSESSNEPFEVTLPTDSTKSNIGGTLLNITAEGEQPFERAVLYLGHLVLDANGEKSAAGFFEQSSPRTVTNMGGHFLFENVEPGEYVLFYWTPQGSLMLLEPGSDADMIFNLKAGEGIDTGRLAYDLPR